MKIGKEPARIFQNYEAALKCCEGVGPSEYRIEKDPKGSGRCIIMCIDEETGEDLGYF